MNVWALKKRDGFTIVELLIVIVVIGILATVSIVAYSGVRLRAENVKTVTSVMAYAKALQLYATTNARYPIVSYPCLGPAGTKCANVTDSTGACTGAGATSFKSAFDDAIKTVASTLPAPSSQQMDCNGKDYGGAWYNSSDGKSAQMIYYLQGSQSCTIGNSLTLSSRFQSTNTTACYTFLPTL